MAAKKPAKKQEFATLESLRALSDETTTVDIDGVGQFEIRALSVREFIEMQEDAKGDDGEVDEWEATRLLLSAAVVKPPLGDDIDLLGSLPLAVTKRLTKEIARVAGTDPDFGGGSPTE